MTHADLVRLCDLYVPSNSRHEGSRDVDGPEWWPAHEIGHMLIAKSSEIGELYFGLDDSVSEKSKTYALASECAAMVISAKLNIIVGCGDLVDDERENTDYNTMTWWDEHDHIVKKLLKERCPRLPRDAKRLEALLKKRLEAANNVSGALDTVATLPNFFRWPPRSHT